MSGEMWLTLAAIAIHAVAMIVGGIWALSNSRQAILKQVADDKHEMVLALDVDRRMVNETLLALRQKINDVELESYKTFVRRDSFLALTREMQDSTNGRLEKIEAKIDRIIEGRLAAVDHKRS